MQCPRAVGGIAAVSIGQLDSLTARWEPQHTTQWAEVNFPRVSTLHLCTSVDTQVTGMGGGGEEGRFTEQ